MVLKQSYAGKVNLNVKGKQIDAKRMVLVGE